MAVADEAKSAELIARLEQLPFSRWHRSFFILAFFGIMFDAADFAMFGAALPPIAREFGLGPAQSGLLATVGLIGAFFGALFWGTVSDYIGRRTSFAATVGIFALFTGLVAASWNVTSLAVSRFLSNFGLGGEVPVTSTLASEFSPGRIRGAMTGNIMAAFPVGLIVAALLSLLIIPTLGWRALFVVGVVPAVLLFFVRRYMPESVRYLLSKGRLAEAEATVAQIERRALGRSLTAEEIRAAPKVRPEVAVPTGVTVFQLFAPGRARTTILVWIVSFGFLWASNGILFMLPTILTQRGIPLTDSIAFQLVQAIGGFFGYSSCSFLIDRYGRRPVLFLYYFVGAFFHSQDEVWFAFGWPYETTACMTRLIYSGIFDELPKLKVITHHYGGIIPFFSGKIKLGFRQIFYGTPERNPVVEEHHLKRAPIDYFKMFYAEQGRGLIRETIAAVEALEISRHERERIFAGNARDLLRLSAEPAVKARSRA